MEYRVGSGQISWSSTSAAGKASLSFHHFVTVVEHPSNTRLAATAARSYIVWINITGSSTSSMPGPDRSAFPSPATLPFLHHSCCACDFTPIRFSILYTSGKPKSSLLLSLSRQTLCLCGPQEIPRMSSLATAYRNDTTYERNGLPLALSCHVSLRARQPCYTNRFIIQPIAALMQNKLR